MYKRITFILTCLAAFAMPLSSNAAIYKHVDENGRVTYSNVKTKGGKKVKLEPADTSFGTSSTRKPKSTSKNPKRATPKSFPKVDAATQKSRDDSRKQILISELESEKKALEVAKEAYKQGESKPEVFTRRNANGTTSTGRNVAKYQEKLKRLQATIDAHQRNINLLEKEISNLN